jgi:hypothetical protein
MDIRAASLKASFPRVLQYTDLRSYLFTIVFVAAGVAVPWGFHRFHLAGATFLPMHLFVLAAGLAFGWRAGLVTGLLTPLVSFSVSGMPPLAILPQVIAEIAAYGLIAGLLSEKYHLGTVKALLGGMAGGRLALLVFLLVSYLISGQSQSPLGAETSPLASAWATVRLGWPGIILQLTLLPLAFWLAGRSITRRAK